MSDSKGAAIDELLDRLIGKNVRPNAYAHAQVDKNAITKSEAKQAILAILAQEVKRVRIDERVRIATLEDEAPANANNGYYYISRKGNANRIKDLEGGELE